MATTGIYRSTNLRKRHYHQNDDSPMNASIAQDKLTIPSKQETVVPKKRYILNELVSIREVRLRSLSHWPHTIPSSTSMASSGWFSCNVNDRTICIYCNIICHQWTTDDEPAAVHARLSPQCPFVLSMSPSQSSPTIINDNFDQKFEPTHPKMAQISRRQETFAGIAWKDDAPSVDDFVRAGFFCAGIENTVTCFYCNGSLHRWGANDNPMVEHARWFPHCTYAKHLCGNQLFKKIEQSKQRLLPENKIDQDRLARLVAARLDLPMVERVRLQYQLAIIKRCFEDQLKIKNDDFMSDLDLTMACMILQRQIDVINGCRDKIIVPSMNQQTETTYKSNKQSLGECLICLAEEKQLACMPCGHLCTCVPCGYSLRSCPICRQSIQSFMRVNS